MKLFPVYGAIGALPVLLAFGVSTLFDVPQAYSQTRQRTASRATAPAKAKPQTQTAAQPQASLQGAAAPVANQQVAQPQEESQQLTPEETEKFNRALELFNKQDLQGALDVLKELSDGNPAARPPRLIVARWFAELQNPQAVRQSLEMATEESPDDPEAFFSLAEYSLRDGALTAAELLTLKGDQVLAKYDGNAQRKASLTRKSATLKLGYANARKRWADAQRAIAALIEIDGETAELDRAYARVLFQQGQDAQAREMFARADKQANGEGLPADAAMSQLYAARGDVQNAQKYLDVALKANPKSTPVLTLAISNALNANDLESAWKLVQQLYQEDKSAEVLKTYGKVALFRSDYKRAEAAFQEAVRQNPLDYDASNGLALALCEQGDAEKNKRAIQYATGNIQKQANNREFLATLGWALYKSGNVDEALGLLQRSTADGQINAASAYYFAVILNEKGQVEEAKNFLNAALSTQPPFAKRVEATAFLAKLNGAAQ